MAWVRLDDNFADHPKLIEAGPLAAWLHVCALCYANRHRTDGRIRKTAIPCLSAIPKPERQVERLVAAGLWDDEGDHYLIHDYLEFQGSREQIDSALEHTKAERSRAGSIGNHRRWHKFTPSSDCPWCIANDRKPIANPSQNGSQVATRKIAKASPHPTPPH